MWTYKDEESPEEAEEDEDEEAELERERVAADLQSTKEDDTIEHLKAKTMHK